MSTKVFGFLELADNKLRISEQIDLAFIMVECATKNRIGIKVGGNLAQKEIQKYGNLLNKLPFELMDDPMDINAECLFSGEGIEIRNFEVRVDLAETLVSRMSRVQGFLQEMLINRAVEKIILDINIEEGDEFKTFGISAIEFSEKIVKLYEQERNWTPTVRFIITL